MMTGTYPTTHKFWEFDDMPPASPVLLQGEARGLITQYIWDEDGDIVRHRSIPLRRITSPDTEQLEALGYIQ